MKGWTPITPDRVLKLMAEQVRPDASEMDCRPRDGCVEGAIGNALTAAMYQQDSDEPDPALIAMYLMRSLARNHCFLDGNKRIAWLVFLTVLLEGSGLTVELPEVEAADLVKAVAVDAIGIEELSRILSPMLVALDMS